MCQVHTCDVCVCVGASVCSCVFDYITFPHIHFTGEKANKVVEHGRTRSKTLWRFPSSGVGIEPLSTNPRDDNFLAFCVVNTNTNLEINRFKAKNIVQMRTFMASLGGTGTGLFTQKSVDSSSCGSPVDGKVGLWDVVHPSEREVSEMPKIDKNQAWESSEGKVPLYEEVMKLLPQAVYFQPETQPSDQEQSFPGDVLPQYDVSTPPAKQMRRPFHDQFLPPHGPPVFYPISIGYGEEVGLEPGIQALWDPVKKYRYFIDHQKKVSFTHDPRPQKKAAIVVKKQTQMFRDDHREREMNPRAHENADITVLSANRALKKRHGFVLVAYGRDGVVGERGVGGIQGQKGVDGILKLFKDNGSPGEPGERGSDGGPGGRGSNGTTGSDVILHISGNPEELTVSGTCSFTAKLGGTGAEEVLFVNCRGGSGGVGGVGGVGGRGGDGGNGGRGDNAMSVSGNGGNGGAGGDGGNGGSGGRGGNGGNAACGGRCLFKTSNPKLLVLVEADCRAGIPGKGGKGGKGGDGGNGGAGGRGGRGRAGSQGEPGGRAGYDGPPGHHGAGGYSGSDGVEGQESVHGGIWWMVLSPEGSLMYEAATRYDVKIADNFKITPKVPDGIFEPNEEIFISNLVALNTGGLPLPAGASVFVPSSETINFKPIKYKMSALDANAKITIPTRFCGRIFDMPPPNTPGPFVGKATFKTRAELLGRPFDPSIISKELVVQYPVKLRYLKCSENAGRGEITVLRIGVTNSSKMPYGNISGSGGKVALRLHFDSRLIPVGWGNGKKESTLPLYSITYDPKVANSMYIEFKRISPGKYVEVEIAVQLCTKSELFDQCYWQADLYLRDKLIEYNFESIRISPFYFPSIPPADMLMVTSKSVTRIEFVYWQTVFKGLSLSVDFWDVGRYNGLSVDRATKARHPTSWIGRYSGKLILYPHCELSNLLPSDITYHFHETTGPDDVLKDLNSSMILFLPSETSNATARKEISVLRHLATAQPSLEIPPKAYSGKHLSKPDTTKPYLEWELNKIKSLEKETPSQMSVVIYRSVQMKYAGMFRYNYGTVDIRRIPLMRSCKFLVIDGSGTNMAHMSIDDANLDTASLDIPLASFFGQVFMTVLFGLTLKKKLEYIKNESVESGEREKQLSFHLPNGYTLSCGELAMICMSVEIADEVYSCERSARRMEEFVQDVEDNMSTYTARGELTLQGLKLIRKEVKKRKKRMNHSDVTKGADEILKLAGKVKKTILSAGVQKLAKDRVLPQLDVLRDGDRFHHSHQYKVSDSRWNLSSL